MNSEEFKTTNSTQTQNLGKKFAKEFKNGGILALFGNLGSGKTTFVQGLAKGLGIKHKIISPTFIIVRKYAIPDSSSSERSESRSKSKLSSWSGSDHDRISSRDSIAQSTLSGVEGLQNDSSRHLPAKQAQALQAGARTINFYHIDLYRIESEKNLEGLGLEEILNDKSNVVAIEWPEKIEKLLPKKRINLYFEYLPAGRQGVEGDKRKIIVGA